MFRKTVEKVVVLTAMTIMFFFVLILNFHISTEKWGYIEPEYEKIDLKAALANVDLTKNSTYELLYLQTGLGKSAVDSVIKDVKFQNTQDFEKLAETFQRYQKNFFKTPKYFCEKIGVITYEERAKDKSGNDIKLFNIPDIKNGDVLITKNTHSLGWRHGHSAIVTDSKKGETLEAVLWGEPSSIQSVSKWQSFPSFILLRPKKEINGAKIAAYAQKNMEGVKYGLFTGIPIKAPKVVSKTQCAHLIWYPYYEAGYDVDYDRGWLVTPKDLANSDYFDVVQVFGVNPLEIWN